MKLQKSFFAILALCTLIVTAQNLHDDANAAFPSNLLINDTNATTGWTSGGTISSVIPTPINNGAYALQLVSTALTANERVIEYPFDATISEVYNISIWVRENDANNTGDNRPEFSNWSDLTGFSTTIITTGTVWTEYTFSVTATSVTPIIRIYAHTNLGTIGDSVQVDNVSITHSSADTTPPSTIGDLSSATITETTLTLNWTAATDNVAVTDYGVFKDGILESLTSGANTYNVTGLTLGNTYAFTVYAIDAASNLSLVSNTLNETTVDATAPTTITDLSSASVIETTLTLNWSASTDNVAVTDYEVFQDAVSIGLTSGAITFNVTSLSPSTAYDFTVFAKDAAGNTSLVSNTLNQSTIADTTVPTTIADLNSASITETTLTLNWSASTDNVAVTDYEVFQDAVSIGLTGGAITFNVTGLTLGNSYDFTVFSKDAAGNTSLVSNTLNETTVDVTAPNAPTSLTSSNTTYFSTDLSWTASTSPDVVGYRVYQDESLIGTTAGVVYNVEELDELTSYAFYITAIDGANNESIESNTETVNTPKENNEIHYTNFNSNLISVDWTTKDLFALGNVGIGTQPDPNYKLAINGNVIAEEIRVALKGSANWPDYVFKKDYQLPTLSEVESYINNYGHLKNIPSADETEKNGISIGEMNSKLLRKIEELTLYIIQQEKKINILSEKNKDIKSLNDRLLEIEETLKKLNK